MEQRLFERIIQWALLIVTFLYILSGFGITQFRIIEPATFGLLGKNLSFAIHDNLLIPFIGLLVVHIVIRPVMQIYQKRKRKKLTLINGRLSESLKREITNS